VKFGIFCEISVPRPWTENAERQAYLDALEHVRLADELGFDQAWAVEHHFLEEYSHCSAPDLFLSACAMQTTHIRLGRGIAVCVPEFNHPAQVAERAAVLDILSNGRLEFGTGRSATWAELGAFRSDIDRTKLSWDEYVRAIPRMWTQERFGYSGTHFTFPERCVLPKPVQRPHPPMWVAVSSPGTELAAADRGLGSLGLTFGGYADQEKRISAYRDRIRSCEPAGSFVNEQVNTVNFLFCHEDADQAASTGMGLARGFNYAAAQVISAREAFPSRSYQTAGLLPRLRQEIDAASSGIKVPEGVAIGSPDQILRAIRGWESIGVDRINFIVSTMGAVGQEDILRSMRLFAKTVMPYFAEADADTDPDPDTDAEGDGSASTRRQSASQRSEV
jgi:alkanesulfonate monooxygenase SsuD/methylene tetrahydromethanopterin reductase-like flavin-dependent oxidoreductase (luciferase family)